MTLNSLLNRPTSGFPISIGTSLALETIFDPIQEVYDPERQVPDKIDKNKYNIYLFNISTLFRNIVTSISYNELENIKKENILDILLDEIDWLTNFFHINNLIINFYIHKYIYVKKTYEAKKVLRVATTTKQIFIEELKNYCLDYIIKQDDTYVFTKNIKIKKDNVLIFTHIPFDLLSYNNFLTLDLLESNTGIVKSRKLWYTKYYSLPNEIDMSFIPLLEYLLAEVFGDRYMFHPSPLNKRMEVYNQLKKLNVNPLMNEFELGLKLFKKVI